MTTSQTTQRADTAEPFTISRDLPVSPDEAFALVTDPERLRRWMAVSARVDLRAGGEYRFTITPGHVAVGTYRVIEPGRRVVFGWGWQDDGALPPDASTVTVTIEPTSAGSRVTLVHEGLDAEQSKAHAEGWVHFFDRLERLATTGDAGPDEWAAVPDRMDPLTAAEAVLAALQPVLRRLTAEDQPKPTPCADFTCHGLAVHLLASMRDVGGMAGVDVVRPESGSLESKMSQMADQAIAGWRTRGLEGAVPLPDGSDFPAAMAASLLSIELMLHGWDIAESSGQRLVVADPLVEYVRSLAAHIIPGGRGRSFRDEVDARADADALERFAAYAGRSPMSVS
jgi:uncharacterized protein (TIGR03086 family)